MISLVVARLNTEGPGIRQLPPNCLGQVVEAAAAHSALLARTGRKQGPAMRPRLPGAWRGRASTPWAVPSICAAPPSTSGCPSPCLKPMEHLFGAQEAPAELEGNCLLASVARPGGIPVAPQSSLAPQLFGFLASSCFCLQQGAVLGPNKVVLSAMRSRG